MPELPPVVTKFEADIRDFLAKAREMKAKAAEIDSLTRKVRDLEVKAGIKGDEDTKRKLKSVGDEADKTKKKSPVTIQARAIGFAKAADEMSGFGLLSMKSAGEAGMFGKAMMGVNLATGLLERPVGVVTAGLGGLAAGLSSAALGLGVFGLVARSTLKTAGTATQAVQQAQTQYNTAITQAQAAYSHSMATATTAQQRTAAATQLATAKSQAQASQVAATNAAYSQMSEGQIKLSQTLGDVQNQWQAFVQHATPGIAKIMNSGIKLLPVIFRMMNIVLKAVEPELQRIVDHMVSVGTHSKTLTTYVTDFANKSGPSISALAHIIANLTMGIVGLLHAFLPTSTSMLNGIAQLTAKFRAWATSAHTGHTVMALWKQDGPAVTSILKSLAGILVTVGKSMANISTPSNSQALMRLLPPLLSFLNMLLKANPQLVYFALYLMMATKGLNNLNDKVKAIKGAASLLGDMSHGAMDLYSGLRSDQAAASEFSGTMGTLGGKIRTAASAIKNAAISTAEFTKAQAKSAWEGLSSGIGKAVEAVKGWTIWSKIAAAATKVWTGIQAAFDAVMDANPIALLVIAIVALAAIFAVLIIKCKPFREFWIHLWGDVESVAKKVWNWLKKTAQDVTDFIAKHWKTMVMIVAGLILGPFGVAIAFILTHLKLVKQWFDDAVKFVQAVWRWLWNEVKTIATTDMRLLTEGIQTFWTWVKDAWHAAQNFILGIWNTFWSTIKSWAEAAWNWVYSGLKRFWGWIHDGFNWVTGQIERIWNKIKGYMMDPVKWVVQYVYDDGIVKMWNAIQGIIHVGGRLQPVKLATGGVVPGQGNQDTVPALLTPGERVLSRDQVATLGGHKAIDNMVRAAGGGTVRGGVLYAQLGAIVSSLGGFAKGVFNAGKSFISDIGMLFTNPLGLLQKALGGALNMMGVHLTPDMWGKAVGQIPRTIVTDIGNWLKKIVAQFEAPAGAGGGAARWAGVILQALALLGQPASWLGVVERRMNQESSGNQFAINLTDINAQSGDPSRGLMQVIGSTFAAYAGPFRGRSIYDPLANVYAGLNYALHRYGTLAALSQPGGYQGGAWNVAAAGTTHAGEMVIPMPWADLVRQMAGTGGAQTITIENHIFLDGKEIALSNQNRVLNYNLRNARNGYSLPRSRGLAP